MPADLTTAQDADETHISAHTPRLAVAAVVVHYRDVAATLACLNHLSQQRSHADLKVIAVNNAYPDPENGWPAIRAHAAQTIDAGRNAGFTGGSNLGIERALHLGCSFVWLLNPDAQPQGDALAELMAAMHANPRLGAVGSRLLSDGPEQPGGVVSLRTGAAHACKADHYDFISGASLLLRAAALRDVGLFDDRLFLYWEDVDLCLRLTAKGWALAVAEGSRVSHRGGGAVGKGSPTQDYYAARNALLVSRKHAPRTFPVAAACILARVTFGKLARLEFDRMGAALQGYWHGLRGKAGPRPEA